MRGGTLPRHQKMFGDEFGHHNGGPPPHMMGGPPRQRGPPNGYPDQSIHGKSKKNFDVLFKIHLH